MKNRFRIVALSIGTALIQIAPAAPPAEINIHGQLVAPGGGAVTGDRAYQVIFYDGATGGSMLGTALTGTVTVSDSGLFNLAVTPPAAVLSASAVWYSVGVDTDVPPDNDASDDVFPTRIRVYSVPFALQAGEVDASGVGSGLVDNAEFDALDGVTGNVQQQLDAIDGAGITQNTSDIAANTSAIMTNTTNIGANTAALADKANSADVYTQAAANSAFVDASGDTMSGALGVDTITEATADAGVSAEGLMLKDSYLGLPQIAAPGDTANKLYNVSGNLFFGGAQLGLSSFDKDGINNAGTLGFDWLDSEIADGLTIQGGSVDNDSFSALSDLNAESAIGTGSGQVAPGNHGHTLSALSGSVTDAQVPDALTIQGGSVNNDSFSALSDLNAESAIGTGAMQLAAGNHDHALSALSGSVTDAQVPDNITINGLDAADDTAGAPAITYASDPNTGIHRPGADQLALVTGGSVRLSVDSAEVNILGNILEMAAGAAPGVTTNKLYNTSGNLFWNGTQLNGGGGSSAEVLQFFSSSTLPELVAGGLNQGYNVKHSDTVTRYVQFINVPTQRTVTAVQVYVNEYETYTGSRTVSLTAHVRDIATGTVAHTVTTASFDATAAANFSWHTLPITGTAADRTVENTEFFAVAVSLANADGGAGEMDLSFRVTVE